MAVTLHKAFMFAYAVVVIGELNIPQVVDNDRE
jgi:hypothetical protein